MNILLMSNSKEQQRFDPLTPTQRSERVALIRNKDTHPENDSPSRCVVSGVSTSLLSKKLPGHPAKKSHAFDINTRIVDKLERSKRR
jgi:hypothetical protein